MSNRPRRLTTTGGSDERRARSMIAPLTWFDIAAEAAALRAEGEYLDGDRNAKTLVKIGEFRLVIVAFRTGATLDEDDQRGSLGLHVLEGRIALRVGKESIEIGPGQVAVVSPHHSWTAVALDDGLVLIQLSWPPVPGSAGAVAQAVPTATDQVSR